MCAGGGVTAAIRRFQEELQPGKPNCLMAAKMGFSRIDRFDAVGIQFRRIFSYAILYPFLSAT